MPATLMEVLDTSVANVSLPTSRSLAASTDEATWVLTSYPVSNAIILPAAAWLGSLFGRKRVLLVCIAIFTLASLACGASVSLGMIVVARVLQGIGGGAVRPWPSTAWVWWATRDLWVVANFKETQLREMRPGQKSPTCHAELIPARAALVHDLLFASMAAPIQVNEAIRTLGIRQFRVGESGSREWVLQGSKAAPVKSRLVASPRNIERIVDGLARQKFRYCSLTLFAHRGQHQASIARQVSHQTRACSRYCDRDEALTFRYPAAIDQDEYLH